MPEIARLFPAKKLALGTVQWGMSYGIASQGQPTSAEVGRILAAGQRAGIDVLDTAHAYGSSEAVIGEHSDTAGPMRVVTKTLPVRADSLDDAVIESIDAAFGQSLLRLRRTNVYAILVHTAANLLGAGGDRLWKLLEKYRASGHVQRIGVSVYNPAECDAITARFPIEIVQLPFNLYDRRFLDTGLMSKLKAAGVEVHTRSAFLQGLLLMPPGALPARFDGLRPHHTRLYDWLREANTGGLAAALHFCLSQPMIDHVVVGCESAGQLGQILEATALQNQPAPSTSFAVSDVNIIEPSRWTQ